MNKDLPIYDIILKDDTQGVGVISLVDEPAIGVDWIKLSKQASMAFKANKDKQLLYGPFLIPNMLIYRHDEKMGEYYVRFSKEEIEKIATKFNEDLNNKNITFQHTGESVDAFVAQNWVIDGEQDKSHNLGFDLPEGSWFGAVKIKDENFWSDKVKSEEVKGFSVEILAELEISLKNKEQKMENEIKLSEAKLADGTPVYYDGELSPETIIYMDPEMTQLAPDADHELEDGTIITTKDGVVMTITPKVEEELAEPVMAPEAAPSASPLTAEEISAMIDQRFADLMEEISRMKELIGEGQTDMANYKKEVNEKFSLTPAVETIKKNEVKIDDKFAKVESRIREFAKNK